MRNHTFPRARLHRLSAHSSAINASNEVDSFVSIVYVTASKTFSGDAIYVTERPANLGPAAEVESTELCTANFPVAERMQLKCTTKVPKTTIQSKLSRKQQSTALSSSLSLTPSATSLMTSETHRTSKSLKGAGVTSSSIRSFPGPVESTSSSNDSYVSNIVLPSATADSAFSASSTSSVSDSSGTGEMSVNAKVGTVFGVLIGIITILSLILYFYHRRKQKSRGMERLDDGKDEIHRFHTALPNNNPGASIGNTKKISVPRLSLRPVTQFQPDLQFKRESLRNVIGNPIISTPVEKLWSDGVSTPIPSPNVYLQEKGEVKNHSDPVDPFSTQPEAIQPESMRSRSISIGQVECRTPTKVDPVIDVPEASVAKTAGVVFPTALLAGRTTPEQLAVKARSSRSDQNESVVSENQSCADTSKIPNSPGPTGLISPLSDASGYSSKGGQFPWNNVHRVQMDFKPSMPDELEIHVGQPLRLLHEYDDGWAHCVRMDRSQQGVVPRTCLSKNPVKSHIASVSQRIHRSPLGPNARLHPQSVRGLSCSDSDYPPPSSPARSDTSTGTCIIDPLKFTDKSSSGHQDSSRNNQHSFTMLGPLPNNASISKNTRRSMSPGPYATGYSRTLPPQLRRRSRSAGQLNSCYPSLSDQSFEKKSYGHSSWSRKTEVK